MSWEGVNWANAQRLRRGPEQHLLLLLGNWATPEGDLRYVSIQKLIDCSRQSRTSVYRNLGLIEELGLMTWQRRNPRDRSPERFSGKLHFLIKVDLADGGADSPEPEQSQIGTKPDQSQVGIIESQVGTDQSQVGTTYRSTGLCTQTEYESPPPPILQPNPAKGADETERREEEEGFSDSEEVENRKRIEREFSEFRAAYPFDPSMSVAAALEAFADLNVKDRGKAIRCAVKYRETLKAKKRDYARHAVNWLRKREFDGITDMGHDTAARAGLAKPKVFVRKGTPAWDAWTAHMTKTKGIRWSLSRVSAEHNKAEGWDFESMFPPGDSIETETAGRVVEA